MARRFDVAASLQFKNPRIIRFENELLTAEKFLLEMPPAENSQIPLKIFERFSREPHFEKIGQEAHIEKFSGGTLFVDLQRTEIRIFISNKLTLRRPLRRKLRMRWFFDVSKVKESSFFKSDVTDPPSDF